jgi:hypothetical protein
MNPLDRRLQLDLAAARYLDAMERDDFAAMAEMWRGAAWARSQGEDQAKPGDAR